MSEARILVVDDNPTNLKLASDLLECFGYQISKAMDAQQALEAIEQTTPDLILMDVGLPGMDGLALTRKLKADDATKRIRIIALTSFAMKGDEQKAFDAGCDGYISKPININALPEQIAEFLRKEIPS